MPPQPTHREVGHGDHDGHLQHELEQVGPQHAPQPAERDVEPGERNQEEDADGQRRAVVAAPHRAKSALMKRLMLVSMGVSASVVPTMLVIALVTQPRMTQFISRPR